MSVTQGHNSHKIAPIVPMQLKVVIATHPSKTVATKRKAQERDKLINKLKWGMGKKAHFRSLLL